MATIIIICVVHHRLNIVSRCHAGAKFIDRYWQLNPTHELSAARVIATTGDESLRFVKAINPNQSPSRSEVSTTFTQPTHLTTTSS
jgi:hypothetical protein